MRYRRILLLTILSIFLILGLTSCGKSANTTKNNTGNTIESSDNIQNIIKGYVQKKLPNNSVESLKIVSRYDQDDDSIIMCSFKVKSQEYDGLFQYNNKSGVIYGNINKTDSSVPFTQHEMSGKYTSNGKENQTYLIVGGKINNKEIKTIKISFADDSVALLKLDETKNTYSYIKDNKFAKITLLEGLDKDDKTVYSYNWKG